MIKLTRLNDSEFVVNAELIKTIEATPDTVVNLTTGQCLIVKEDVDEVIKKAINYRRQIQFQPE
ncbi:flagellar FlbD family protein [Halanaerocella petrolearia]